MTQCIKISYFFDAQSCVEVTCYRSAAVAPSRERRMSAVRNFLGAISDLLAAPWILQMGDSSMIGFPSPYSAGFHAVGVYQQRDRVFNR